MATERRSIVWIDANGFTRQTQPRGSASLFALQADMVAKSNAAVASFYEGTETIAVTPTATAAVYQNVSDTAQLFFQTAGGDIVTLVLPAPISAIFLPDGRTVDPSAIAAIIADAIAVLTDPSGNPVVAYIGGTRRGFQS